MRIAHVTCLYPPDHLGGAPQQCAQIVQNQAALGHEVRVFSGRLDPGAPMYELKHATLGGIPVTFLNTVDAFDETSGRNWSHPEVEPFFERFLAAWTPEIVHFHSIQSLGASLLPVAQRSGAKVVVTLHDLWWVCERQFCVDRSWKPCIPMVTPGSCSCGSGTGELTQRNSYLRSCLQSADLMLSPSAALIDRVRSSGLDGTFELDPNGIDSESIKLVDRSRGGPLRILFVGGSSGMKGLEVLIAALHQLHDQELDYVCDVYGVDPFAFRTTRSLGRLSARSHKAFRPEKLPEVLANADVLVLPSVMFESSSRIVREALTRGVPVVATETGGPEAVIEPGINGLLVPPADPGALAAALERLIRDPRLLGVMRGRGPVGEVPTGREQATHLVKLYGEIPTERLRRASGPAPPMRVLFLAGIEGAPLRYRVHHAAEQLALRGVESVIRHYADPRTHRDLDSVQVIIVYRSPATRELLALIREANRRGLTVVFDIDDLVFDPELAAELPGLRGLSADARRLWVDGVRRYRATLEECGRALGSTPEIVRRMRAIGIDARIHSNGVGTALAVASEMARRSRSSRTTNHFRVGYFSGTDTHDEDLEGVSAALSAFGRAHPEVELVLGGLLRPHPALRSATRIPFTPWHLHPHNLAALDLNLAPLSGGPFNEAKSSIKWSEAALVDVPTVASATEPFRDSIEIGRTGFLFSDVLALPEVLDEAYSDRERLERIGRMARRAAYVQGSPWTRGLELMESLSHFMGTAVPDRAESMLSTWPSESQITELEPLGLFPGLLNTSKVIPGETLDLHRVAFPVPSSPGSLRRVDVAIATFGRRATGTLHLSVHDRGGNVRTVTSRTAEDIGDGGWCSFDLEPDLDLTEAGSLELSAAAGSGAMAVWLGSGGSHQMDGRTKGGAVAARTFNSPPIPPDFPVPDNHHSGPLTEGRWTLLPGFVSLVARQALYILRVEGPLKGTRRITRAARRRLSDLMLTRKRR